MKTITIDVATYFTDDRFSDAPQTQDRAEEYTVNTARSKLQRGNNFVLEVINVKQPDRYHKLGIELRCRVMRMENTSTDTSTMKFFIER